MHFPFIYSWKQFACTLCTHLRNPCGCGRHVLRLGIILEIYIDSRVCALSIRLFLETICMHTHSLYTFTQHPCGCCWLFRRLGIILEIYIDSRISAFHFLGINSRTRTTIANASEHTKVFIFLRKIYYLCMQRTPTVLIQQKAYMHASFAKLLILKLFLFLFLGNFL